MEDAMTRRKQLGQYFTTHERLLNMVQGLVRNTHGLLLEPSSGAGHIVQHLWDHGERRHWTTVEIDATIPSVLSSAAKESTSHIVGDFLRLHWSPSGALFHTIVGNPPYVKIKGGKNAYLLFLERCIGMLVPGGEMIMIIPTDFLFATHARQTRLRMFERGCITDVLRPDAENLFEGANQDVIVIRYQNGAQNKGRIRYLYGSTEGSLQFEAKKGTFNFLPEDTAKTIGDVFDVKVGMVSGADDVFRHPTLGNVPFLTRNGNIIRYIWVEQMPSGHPEIDAHLVRHKERLLARKIRGFDEDNWFEWGAVRNAHHMGTGEGSGAADPCIYIETLTRRPCVAFAGRRMHFDGNLLCLYPKEPMADAALQSWLEHFNSDEFQKNHRQAGRFKMGQRTLSTCPVPSHLA